MKVLKKIIVIIVALVIIVSGVIIIIDPFFHYHKPLIFINYFMDNNQQRYMNDGIVKRFEYNAIITGTSMTENFKNSQFDKLFHTNSIKVPFSGGSYKEVNNILQVALKNNKNIKYILRGLDYGEINEKFDKMSYDSYPEYLYDNNLFNDYKYVLNRGAFFQSLLNILKSFSKKEKINFDEYSSWRNSKNKKGKEIVLRTYKRLPKEKKEKVLSKREMEKIDKNIEKNVIKIPKEYPDVKFIYFITPYSIVYWDELNQKNELEKQISAEKYMIEKILEIPNIELYSFYSNYSLVTDLENYKDSEHYIGEINDQILCWIKAGEYRLSKKNYKEYIRKNLEFYKNYNYDKIFQN